MLHSILCNIMGRGERYHCYKLGECQESIIIYYIVEKYKNADIYIPVYIYIFFFFKWQHRNAQFQVCDKGKSKVCE